MTCAVGLASAEAMACPDATCCTPLLQGPHQAQLQWLTAYSLVFRSVFPGTRGKLSVVGRATLSIDGLRSGGALATGLGDGLSASSLVVVCDSAGVVVAAQEPGLQLLVESPSGRVRFRKAWEMEGPWASGLSPGAFQAAGTSFDAEGFHVAVVPLLGRGLEGFFVVVAVERRRVVPTSEGSGRGILTTLTAPWAVRMYQNSQTPAIRGKVRE